MSVGKKHGYVCGQVKWVFCGQVKYVCGQVRKPDCTLVIENEG